MSDDGDLLSPRRAIPSELAALKDIASRETFGVPGMPTIRMLLRHIAWMQIEIDHARGRDAKARGNVVRLPARMTREEREIIASRSRAGECDKCRPIGTCQDVEGCTVACRSGKDGECQWLRCPQLRDGEPGRSGRHCPRDKHDDQDDWMGR